MLKMMLLAIGQRIESQSEPTIRDILSDSIVKAMMEADEINPQTLELELKCMAHQISARRVRSETLRVAHKKGSVHCRPAVDATTRDVPLPQGET